MKHVMAMSIPDQVWQWVMAAVISVAAFFAPMWPSVLLVGFMSACDLATGVRAAKKRDDYEGPKGLYRTMDKLIGQGVAILVGHVIGAVIFRNLPGAQIVAGAIVLVELRSIRRNIQTIYGFDILRDIAKHIRRKR
jgi:hypothetical protein